MTHDPELSREQAARARRLADQTWDRDLRKRLLELSEEFEREASQSQPQEAAED